MRRRYGLYGCAGMACTDVVGRADGAGNALKRDAVEEPDYRRECETDVAGGPPLREI